MRSCADARRLLSPRSRAYRFLVRVETIAARLGDETSSRSPAVEIVDVWETNGHDMRRAVAAVARRYRALARATGE